MMFAVAALFAAGFILLLSGRISMLPLGILMVGNGANLAIFSGAGLTMGAAPLLSREGTAVATQADPVAQALVLTAIVIGFGLLVFLLALCLRIANESGVDSLSELRQEEES